MHFVYILYSVSRQKFYIGYTTNLVNRIIKHNSKHKAFTDGIKDWEIVFTDQFETKEEAISREKQIKGWKSRQLIEALVEKGSPG